LRNIVKERLRVINKKGGALMINRNLDKIDRVLRFLLAFWWLGPLAPQFSAEWVSLLIFIVGWIALVESFLGWCGLHRLFNIKKSLEVEN